MMISLLKEYLLKVCKGLSGEFSTVLLTYITDVAISMYVVGIM